MPAKRGRQELAINAIGNPLVHVGPEMSDVLCTPTGAFSGEPIGQRPPSPTHRRWR